MRRLHELTEDDLLRWRDERARVGKEKYDDAHLRRYNLVDVMEELLDALNIFSLFVDRACDADWSDGVTEGAAAFQYHTRMAQAAVLGMDAQVPDEYCTDEQGGERVWWGDRQ